MSEPAALDGEALKLGLLMEGAETQQRLTDAQLERLRTHTEGLDEVVRDAIRRTLIEELQDLAEAGARATRALEALQRRATYRGLLAAATTALLCTLIPVAVLRWMLPSAAELAAQRAQAEVLARNLAHLQQSGARVDWRRCGTAGRLCVRVDREAPVYGAQADYYVVKGY